MVSRLPVAPERVDDVATAALVCRQTVQRYRMLNPDGTAVWRMLPAVEAAITRAIRELPASAQLEIYSATLPSSTGESAGAITGTVEYVCPGGRNAASPVSTKSKDPVSAPARAAAGGDENE